MKRWPARSRWVSVGCSACKALPGERCRNLKAAARGGVRLVNSPHPVRVTASMRQP